MNAAERSYEKLWGNHTPHTGVAIPCTPHPATRGGWRNSVTSGSIFPATFLCVLISLQEIQARFTHLNCLSSFQATKKLAWTSSTSALIAPGTLSLPTG